jgi:hypothetical protein
MLELTGSLRARGRERTIGLAIAATLTDSGTITTEPAHGGGRTLEGNLTNTGTIAINANTSYDGASALRTKARSTSLKARN